jgi:hypothetical protein
MELKEDVQGAFIRDKAEINPTNCWVKQEQWTMQSWQDKERNHSID